MAAAVDSIIQSMRSVNGICELVLAVAWNPTSNIKRVGGGPWRPHPRNWYELPAPNTWECMGWAKRQRLLTLAPSDSAFLLGRAKGKGIFFGGGAEV